MTNLEIVRRAPVPTYELRRVLRANHVLLRNSVGRCNERIVCALLRLVRYDAGKNTVPIG